jgi:hypothetical protein
MSSKNDIREAIRDMADKNESVYSIPCLIIKKSIDKTELICDCSPVNGDADLLGVRLMAEKNTGFLIIPKDESLVLVTMINKHTGYVAMFSEVEEIQLNGDNYDGLVKINDLVNKLNALENLVNNILTTLKATTIPLAPSGTYPFAPLYTAFSNIAPITSKNDLENQTVLHGNG